MTNDFSLQARKERHLGFDPLSVSYFSNGDLLLISGSNKEVILYTRDGIKVGNACVASSWIWAAKVSSDGKHVVST